jgi:hypothetical protein
MFVNSTLCAKPENHSRPSLNKCSDPAEKLAEPGIVVQRIEHGLQMDVEQRAEAFIAEAVQQFEGMIEVLPRRESSAL